MQAMACSAGLTPTLPSFRHSVSPRSQFEPPSNSLFQGSLGRSVRQREQSLTAIRHRHRLRVQCKASPKETGPTAESSLPVKAAWHASEAFGQAVALFRPKKDKEEEQEADEDVLPLTHEEVVALLRADYDKSYFVTG
jgi:hypothetical protein